MNYKVANLSVQIPHVGDMENRAKGYISTLPDVDISIEVSESRLSRWEGELPINSAWYLETGFDFYRKLLAFDGLMLHASCAVRGGYAYLFSGPCGMGKSTHTKLYQQLWGSEVQIINDDKPALRRENEVWTAYGTPWCGKDGINQNASAPIAGICFLRRGEETSIRRLAPAEATPYVMAQTMHRLKPEQMMQLLPLVDKLVSEVPCYELYSHAEPEAAQLTYETMRPRTKEETK